MTTVKIDTDVRDRLRALARRHGHSMGDEIAALVERAEQTEMWGGYRDALARLAPSVQAQIETHAAHALQSATEVHRRAAAW